MIGVSGDRMVDLLLYGAPSERTRNYFQNELNTLSSVLTPNHWAVDTFKNAYDHYYSQQAVDEAQMHLSQSASQFRDDIIHSISYDKYTPNLLTQRYIMACPEVWDLKMKGLSNDFNMQYRDPEPWVKDIYWRNDYIDIMDGVLTFDKEGNGYYVNYVREETSMLSKVEKDIIYNNWMVVRDLLANDEDPTII